MNHNPRCALHIPQRRCFPLKKLYADLKATSVLVELLLEEYLHISEAGHVWPGAGSIHNARLDFEGSSTHILSQREDKSIYDRMGKQQEGVFGKDGDGERERLYHHRLK